MLRRTRQKFREHGSEAGRSWGYLLALAGTAVAVLLRWVLNPFAGDHSPYVVFYFTIALAAVFGGRGPGLLALGLAAIAGTWLFVSPRYALALDDYQYQLKLLLFLASGGLVVLLAAWARSSRQAAREHADFAERILQGMADGYFAVDGEWRITDTNDQAERILGKPRHEFLGKDIRDWFPGPRVVFKRESERVMRERVTCRFEECCRATGKCFDISLYPADGGLAVFFRDVTEHRRAQEALRESEERFRGMIQAVPSLTFEADAAGNNTFVSDQWCAYTGLSAEEAAGSGWLGAVHPDEVEAVRARWSEIVRAGEPFESQGRLRAKDGSYRWFLFRAAPARDAAGNVVRWAGSLTDIDDLIRTQEALRSSEEFERRLLASSYDCIKVLDLNFNLLSMGEGGCRLMEIEDIQPYLNKPYINFWPPQYRPLATAALEAALAGGVGRFEGCGPSVTGTLRWWDVRVTEVMGQDGKPERLLVIARDTTDVKRAEEALRASEERLRLVNEAAKIGTYDADVRTGQTLFSPELCEILGLSPGYTESQPERVLEFVHPEDRDLVRAAVAKASDPAGDGVSRGELRITRPGGEVRWISWSGRTFFEDTPQGRVPVRAVGACIDVTQRRAAEEALRQREEALRESEEKFRSLAENMRAAVGMVQGTRFIYANRYMAELLGYSVEELLSLDFPALVRPDYRARMLEFAWRRQQGQPVPGNYEFPALTKSGEVRWMDFWPARIVYKGKPAIVGAGFDITQRKQMEMKLRESEEKFRLLAERSRVMIGIIRDRRFLYVNPCIVETSGYTREELLSLDIAELIHPDELELALSRAARRQCGEDLGPSWEYRLRDKSGRIHWVQVWPVQIYYEGAPAVMTAGIDVTERKISEEILRGRTRALKLLSEAATKLLKTERPQDVLKEIFTELAENLGVEICLNYFLSTDRPGIEISFATGIDEESRKQVGFLQFGQGVCGTVAKTGQSMVVEDIQHSQDPVTELLRQLQLGVYACHPMKVHGRVVGTLAFGTRRRNHFAAEELDLMRAVSDQVALALERRQLLSELEKRAEELAQANRAKDNFLAILSHELRTPLTPVLATVSMLQEQLGLDPETLENLEVVHRNVELEARLIDDLLDLTRVARGKIQLHKSRAELGTIVARAVEVCTPDLEARELHFTFEAGPVSCWVEADVARLQQVFWNLLKNSIKFTPRGGYVGVRCGPAGEGLAGVEVTDSGQGIEPEALGRIFNAFEQVEHSHSGPFGGLGLGLTISKALVELHGGTIEAYSAGIGRGASFRVKLPTVPPPAALPEGAPRAVETQRAESLRILLVEDHGDTARIWSSLLRRRGHHVEVAGDVATALRAASSEPFDLVISDLGLPDASGLELMQQLRRRRPHLKGIALSGYGTEDDVQRSREAGFSEHLTKPVDLQTLQAAITRVGRP